MTSTPASFDTLLTVEGIKDGQMISIKRSALLARLISAHLPHGIPDRESAARLQAVDGNFDMNVTDQKLIDTWKAQRARFIQRMKAGGSPYLPNEDPEAEMILGHYA